MKTLLTALLLGLPLGWLVIPASSNAAAPVIRHLTLAATINPATAGFIIGQSTLANQQNDAAILIQLDTPGGLDTSMREIVKAELNSTIPVIVFVAPQGARAASAGAIITLAADFAAMAPGTNIGAAHPVALGPGNQPDSTMTAKVANDAAAYARSLAQQRGRNQDWAEQAVRESVSISAKEALELLVIDFIADSPVALLQQLEGLTYLRGGQKFTFSAAGAQLTVIEMNWRQQILAALSNPNIAYLLLMLGILGIFFEISQPGVILPGAIGTIAILLAFFALSSLPVNYVGVLLILLAVVLFVLEIKVTSYGMLSIGGIIALTFGSLMLIDSSEPYLQISRVVIAATVAVSGGFFLLATGMVIRTQRRPISSGQEGLVGECGQVVETIDGSGQIFVHGEYWRARSGEIIPVGQEVVVVALRDGLELDVKAKSTRAKTDHTALEE